MSKIFAACVIAVAICGCAASTGGQPVAIREGDLRARLDRADAAFREARLLDAEVLYRELSYTNPTLPEIWLRLGSIYVRQGQLEAAGRAYRDGMRIHAEDGRLWFNLALVQLRQATETLEVSSEILPEDSPYRESIGRLHRALLDVSARPSGGGTAAEAGMP